MRIALLENRAEKTERTPGRVSARAPEEISTGDCGELPVEFAVEVLDLSERNPEKKCRESFGKCSEKTPGKISEKNFLRNSWKFYWKNSWNFSRR